MPVESGLAVSSQPAYCTDTNQHTMQYFLFQFILFKLNNLISVTVTTQTHVNKTVLIHNYVWNWTLQYFF